MPGQYGPSGCSTTGSMSNPWITRSEAKLCSDGDRLEIKKDHGQYDVSLPLALSSECFIDTYVCEH